MKSLNHMAARIGWREALAFALTAAVLHIIYNLYFHPLAKFAGPFWARSSLVSTLGGFDFERGAYPLTGRNSCGGFGIPCADDHIAYSKKRTGNMVRPGFRVTPNELSFASTSSWKAIYGYPTPGVEQLIMGELYDIFGGAYKTGCIDSKRNPTVHACKKNLTAAFAAKALATQEPIVQVKCTGQLSGCQRCETLDIECTYTTGTGKKRHNSLNEGTKKDDEPMNRPPQPTEQTETSGMAIESQRPLPDAMSISDVTFADIVEPGGAPSTFTEDIEQWSLFSAFDSDPKLAASITDAFMFPSASGTSHDVDMSFWGDHPPVSTTETMSSTMTYQNRSTPGGTSTGSTAVGSHGQTNTPAEPVHEPEIETRTQADPQLGTVSTGQGQIPYLEQKACSCLQRIFFLINELETDLTNVDDDDDDNGNELGRGSQHTKRGLESAMGLLKEALLYGDSMRQCHQCSHRTETRMLLLLLANRLVVLCGDMVSAYQNATNHTSCRIPAATHEPAITIMVGEYEVKSDAERSVVLRELVAFQLRALYSFVISLAGSHQQHGTGFDAAKNKVADLLRRLHTSSLVLPAQPPK
ncbi:Uu.00g021870.m01.CDS01 [Anthostomella pinea]|uniref:Uu.00g021870.m01.CDS01 n=1 Tax=Anthostomella pinea TaxID=933095 RepID=A0AAI8W0Y9_9PEZI|nr:Uu.00g021870.m01.CDS01 [Anthostomella pinea]